MGRALKPLQMYNVRGAIQFFLVHLLAMVIL